MQVATAVHGDSLRVELGDCAALAETVGPSWSALLVDDDEAEVCSAIAHAIDPALQARRVTASSGAVAGFEIVRNDRPSPRHQDVELARFSTGADFAFSDEGTRVQLRARRDRPEDLPYPAS